MDLTTMRSNVPDDLALLFRPQDGRSSETSVHMYHFLHRIISNSHKTRLHCTVFVVCLILAPSRWTFLRNVGTSASDYTASHHITVHSHCRETVSAASACLFAAAHDEESK
jgi:hypothetical protein